MKKILFITLSTLIVTSCSGGRSGTGSGGDDPRLIAQCEEINAIVVNGVCACPTGWAFDSQDKCVQIQLATPSYPVAVGVPIGGFMIAFNPVKDINSNLVSSGHVHFIYKNMTVAVPDKPATNWNIVSCTTTYTDALDCNTSNATVYSTQVPVFTAGTYCLKAISCASGYKDSELYVRSMTASGNGSGTGTENGNDIK